MKRTSVTLCGSSSLLPMMVFLVCLTTGCATQGLKPEEIASVVAGDYGARIPGEAGSGRILHLSLSRDHSAIMKTLSHKGAASFTETGQWETQPDGSLIVHLTRKDGRQYEKPAIIVFALQAKGLEAIAYDREVWGTAEIVFERQPEIAGVVWYLQEIRYIDGKIIRADDPSKYTLAPAKDGAVVVQADCNQGKGTYLLVGTSISFKDMAYTRAACFPASYGNQYVRALAAAATCALEDGHLVIGLEMNSGIMRFVPARAVR